MNDPFVVQASECCKWIARLPAGGLVALAVAGFVPGAASAQTAPVPALSFVFTDPVGGARCLAGEGCGAATAGFESRPLACIADEIVKTIPPYLKAEAQDLSRSALTAECRTAAEAMARRRDEIRELYARAPGAPVPDALLDAAAKYAETCLSPQLEQNHGPISLADRSFLRQHTGLILRREGPTWQSQQPVCQAARLGRYIVTARNCIFPDGGPNLRPGDTLDDIAFRFFDQPTTYSLTLRQLGGGGGPSGDQANDYAIFEIPQTPFLDEDAGPLTGSMRLFDNIFTATTNVTTMLRRGFQSGAALDFNSAAYVRMNTLCRPAYIAPDGIFLHGCQIDSVLSNGAPIFQRRDGRLVFVGIHSGDTSALKQPALAACATGLSRYGIAIPPDVIRSLAHK